MERTKNWKTFLMLMICVVLVVDSWGRVLGQSSPAPTITDYAQSALPDTLAIDTAFCKGQTMTIHGQYFKRAQGGESWDTTRVFFGGLSGVQGQILSITTASGGTNDYMQLVIPDVYMEDTCLQLTIIKTTIQGSTPFNLTVTDTVCLLGDFVQISYSDTLFCIGEANPLPTIVTSSSTSGAFCCEAGASGFFVQTSGEVPLYSGSVGIDNTFEYHTNHPYCPDTIQFKIDILQSIASQARYNGQPTLTICSASTNFPVADSATLIPGFGSGHFADPTGNVFVMDSLTGLIDPGQCQSGTHDLLYIPHLPCHDTAVVTVTVTAPATAQVIYPGISSTQPHLCQNEPTQNPGFLSGSPGGQFWSVPAGIAFGQVGEILPPACAIGNFDVFYRPPGSCADTVSVLIGLVVDSAVVSDLGFATVNRCLNDTLYFAALPSGWIGVFNGSTQLYSGNNVDLALSQFGLSGGEALQITYTRSATCADTDFATVNVLVNDNASFGYPNPAYCLGDADPFPVLAGQGGGTFSALTSATVLSSLGRIRLDSSGPGSHTIVYTTNGSCPASDTVSVQIFSAASAQFSYSASTFCLGEPDPMPTIGGAPGGMFTADSGLVVHPDSGTIDISLSQAGTYNVTYTLTGGCNTSFSQTIQIIPFDSSSSFSYPIDNYCRNGGNPVPALFGDSAGTFYGSIGLVFSNRDSGIVDLSRTDPGVYVITLDLDNRCAVDPRDTLTILELDNSDFSYSTTEVCEGGAPLFIDTVGAASSGVFTSHPSIVFVDSSGTIDLQNSLPGGPFPIYYTSNGPCPTTSQQSLTIYPRPQGELLESYPGGSVCSGEQISFRAVATGATGYSFFVNGDSVTGLFDLYQSDSFQDGDEVLCILSNSAGCTDTISTTAQIAPIPETVIKERPARLARLDPLRIKVVGVVEGTVYHWTAIGIGPVQVYETEGQTVTLSFAEENTFEIGFRLTKTTDPATIQVVLQPWAGDCQGKADTVLVEILPSTQAIFVPEVMTPNGDGLNDSWIIQWLPEINPDDYEIHLYNRAGGEVALIRPLHPNWDAGTLPDGVYWWRLTGRNRQVASGPTFKADEANILQAGGLTIRRK
jgi:gliding motility-associated-like protein